MEGKNYKDYRHKTPEATISNSLQSKQTARRSLPQPPIAELLEAMKFMFSNDFKKQGETFYFFFF